jgi:hypothetical protein
MMDKREGRDEELTTITGMRKVQYSALIDDFTRSWTTVRCILHLVCALSPLANITYVTAALLTAHSQ